MSPISKQSLSGGLLLLAALALSACGNVSRNVAPNGANAEQLIWPAPDSTTPMNKGGTYPLPSALRALQAGQTKQQIAKLIGNPHFSEGVWGVREWNYLFNFREPDSNQVVQCQFKILFDQDHLARSFYWLPEDCSRFVNAPAPAAPLPQQPQQQPVAAPLAKDLRFSADALFAFDSATLQEAGRAKLDEAADQLMSAQAQVQHIRVIGYTDRLGSDAYNDALSERRAQAVRQYLVDRGVSAGLIEAVGRGKADPVVQCADVTRKNELIACLAPNRRVDVHIDARGG